MRRTWRGRTGAGLQSEEAVLRWLAGEYDVAFTALDDVEPDRQLLSLFPRAFCSRKNCCRCGASTVPWKSPPAGCLRRKGLDALKTLTGLNLKPVLTPTESLQRE
jgi:hypothetical protein